MSSQSSQPSNERGTGSPRVSVVIPVGRVDADLTAQMEALANQTYEGSWELVLSCNTSDGAEGAKLEELVAEFPSIVARIVDSSDRQSAAHARNVGARAALGEYLLFCDGDDIADKGWIEAMVAALATERAVGGHLDEELLAVPGQEDWRPPATPGGLSHFLGFPYFVSANMGLHATDFLSTDGFDVELIRGEDIAFSWDLLDLGIELAYAPGAIVHYRHRKGMRAMMQQHYLYGRGFSQLLSRRGLPKAAGDSGGLASLRPNGQSVDRVTLPYFLRRGSIAAGRVVGLVEERLAR